MIYTVTAQLRGPSASSPGQITQGHFIIDGTTLVMTYADGSPVDEHRFRAQLKSGDDASAIARVLVKQIRPALMGLTDKEDAFFNRDLNYSQMGSVA